MQAAAKADRYHHGDLKAALVDSAAELIAERGIRGFSMAELSRRLGVTVAAPYRHFADRDELLAAVAVRAVRAFEAALAAEVREGDPPEQRLAAMVSGYVRFAAEQRPLFDVLYGADLDKTRFPELQRAWLALDQLIGASVRALCPDEASAEALETALEATAHGHAMLLLDAGNVDGDAVRQSTQRAARAALAIIAGRAAL
jgi:AcrR family transcriptional regulator